MLKEETSLDFMLIRDKYPDVRKQLLLRHCFNDIVHDSQKVAKAGRALLAFQIWLQATV